MSSRPRNKYLWLIFLALIISNQACIVPKSPPVAETQPSIAAQASPSESSIPLVSTPEVLMSPVPSITPTMDSVIPSPTISSIKITAVKGNLFIRRGPDLAYNPIAVLLEGQSAPVLAHDVLGNWVEVPISTLPGKTGWISIQTVFSSISGNLMDMPEVLPTDWPVASYLRNCTYHQMLVEPGNTTLPALNNSPDNEMWIFPGIHKVYDTDVEGQPEVLSVDLREGMRVDIRVDGNGDHRKCP